MAAPVASHGEATLKSEAGGGTSQAMDPHNTDISTFEASVLTSLRFYYDQLKSGANVGLPKEQVDEIAVSDLSAFMKHMGSVRSNALLLPPLSNLDLPLSSYFISSSHNTYLTGHQLYGTATVDGYKNVLLRGCRCVEIDCWNGEDDEKAAAAEAQKTADLALTTSTSSSKPSEPIVTHGYTATKDITFRSVCESIRDYAFVATDLPLIVSLEVHTNHTQQKLMVDIMNECFKDKLAKGMNQEDWGPDTALPTPNKMKNKILVKVKFSPPKSETPEETAPLKKVETSSSSEDESGKTKTKVDKVIEDLSKLGLYTRSFHFSSLSQPEAKVPTHIFSLSETSLIGLYKDDPEGLFNHNKAYMMRAYPKGIRISSSNLDPSHFWRAGVQMVALNWQKIDKGMMLQEAMFQATGGWAEKPKAFLSNATYNDSRSHFSGAGKSWLRITMLAAQNIPLPHDVEAEDKLKPFIKCEVHVDYPELSKLTSVSKGFGKDGSSKYKLKTSAAKGRHPQFDQLKPLEFKDLPPLVPELSFVRFKVVHSDRFGRDDAAAWACIRLDRLNPGLRFIHLWDAQGSPSDGVILAKIEYQWNVSA